MCPAAVSTVAAEQNVYFLKDACWFFSFNPQVNLTGTHPSSLFMSPNKPGGAHMWKSGGRRGV